MANSVDPGETDCYNRLIRIYTVCKRCWFWSARQRVLKGFFSFFLQFWDTYDKELIRANIKILLFFRVFLRPLYLFTSVQLVVDRCYSNNRVYIRYLFIPELQPLFAQLHEKLHLLKRII